MTGDELYRRMEGATDGWCRSGRRFTGVSRRACERMVLDRIGTCRRTVQVPASITGRTAFRRYSRPYFDCIRPGLVCNGVEVRSRAAARRHCGARPAAR